MRLRIQRAIEDAGFSDFRITHMNVFAWLPDSGARIGDLARQAQLSKQTMTELVAYLEKHGYVRRTRDPRDGRAWIITFTKRGAALDQVARRTLLETEAEWAHAIGQRTYFQLRKGLEQLLAVAETADLLKGAPFADLSDHRPVVPTPSRKRARRARSARRAPRLHQKRRDEMNVGEEPH
jgi:DNA-binding MarR family transcriptional regulator